eukprot:Rhum_TRINITY_DN12154_c1_g1::Rhum_TRINITY_DN12154_c1_g1_i1::g.49702::m.49702
MAYPPSLLASLSPRSTSPPRCDPYRPAALTVPPAVLPPAPSLGGADTREQDWQSTLRRAAAVTAAVDGCASGGTARAVSPLRCPNASAAAAAAATAAATAAAADEAAAAVAAAAASAASAALVDALRRRLDDVRLRSAEQHAVLSAAAAASASLEREREAAERQLLVMAAAGAGCPSPAQDEEVASLRAQLQAAKDEIEELKAAAAAASSSSGHEDSAAVLDELRSQLGDATSALLQERRRVEELEGLLRGNEGGDDGGCGGGSEVDVDADVDVEPPVASGAAGHAVVGLEIGEGAHYHLDGVWVASVVPRGPADKAGIAAGDVVTDVDGSEVRDRASFRRHVERATAGQAMRFRVVREHGAHSKVKVVRNLVVTLAWSARKPEGKRRVCVSLGSNSPRSPSPPRVV